MVSPTFDVGAIGHRPNRLAAANPAQLTRVVIEILIQTRDAVSGRAAGEGRPPALRVIASLAEGADRIVARAALSLGFHLCCPMPFPQAEYERSFEPPFAQTAGALADFREILAHAAREGRLELVELHGSRESADAAYREAGRTLLDRSDLLIAVWDGQPAAGDGGTVEQLQDALDRGLPVICIDAASPHAWRILGSAATDIHQVVAHVATGHRRLG